MVVHLDLYDKLLLRMVELQFSVIVSLPEEKGEIVRGSSGDSLLKLLVVGYPIGETLLQLLEGEVCVCVNTCGCRGG